MDQQKIGNFIISLRKENNMTQAELGDKVGVTDRAVSRWENGHNLPDIMVMEKLSEVFNITLVELMNGEKAEVIKEADLDKLTENAIAYHKARMRAYFKRLIIGLLAVIGVLFVTLLLIFCINNFNKCKVYRIESDTSDMFVTGMVVKTNKSTKLVISNFEFRNFEIESVYAIDYHLMINGKDVFHAGDDLEKFEITRKARYLDKSSYFKTLTIYLDNFQHDEIFESTEISIEFRYINDKGIINYYSIPIKLVKEFSNSKLLYF